MSKKKNLQVLTTGVALAIASIGTTALAQETRVKTTAVNEPAYRVLQNEEKKSSDLKPQLDTQEVVTKKAETEVKNNQSELALKEKAVKDAQVAVVKATQTVKDTKEKNKQILKNASKADANREQAIKSAQTDVNTKNDAVKLAKEKLTSANQHADSVENKLQSAQAELKSAQDKLANTSASKDVVQIGNPTFHISDSLRDKIGAKSNDITYKDAFDLWEKDGIPGIAHPDNEDIKRVMRGMAVKMKSASTITIDEADKKRPIDLNNLTDAQLVEIGEFYAKMITQLKHNFGQNASKKVQITKKTLDYSKSVAKKYEKRALDPDEAGHIPGGLENLVPMGDGHDFKTMYDLKYGVKRSFELSSYEDEPSKWGHLINNLSHENSKTVALTVANINGRYWMITTFGSLDSFEGDKVVTKEIDTASLEKAVATAKSNLEQAKTASENAKKALTKASTDYASALSLKTEAEKVLARAMATPLQAQVAENNLRLAKNALENAKKREAKAKNDVTSAKEKLKKSVSKLATEKEKLSKLKEQYKKLLQTESKNKEVSKGSWIQTSGRWWYKHNNGSYTTNGWEQINGKWYHFDSSGWMQTGWVKSSGSWYYLNNSGAMQTGWAKSGNSWYYLNDSGAMQTGWTKSGNSWYYLNGSGAMQTGWLKTGGSWYYLNGSGAMKTGWFTVSGKWYYAYHSGALAVNTTTPEGYKVNYNGEWVK